MRSLTVSRADSTQIGMSLPSARSAVTTATPSSSGICTSSTSASCDSLERRRSASLPVAATRTSKPQWRNPRATEVRTSGSSSTISTMRPAPSCTGSSCPTCTTLLLLRGRTAATVPQVDQRLADALQVRLHLRVGVQVVLHLVLDCRLGLPFEAGEERVHIRVAEQVRRGGRRDAGRYAREVSG